MTLNTRISTWDIIKGIKIPLRDAHTGALSWGGHPIQRELLLTAPAVNIQYTY